VGRILYPFTIDLFGSQVPPKKLALVALYIAGSDDGGRCEVALAVAMERRQVKGGLGCALRPCLA